MKGVALTRCQTKSLNIERKSYVNQITGTHGTYGFSMTTCSPLAVCRKLGHLKGIQKHLFLFDIVYMHMYFNNDFLEGEKNTIHPTYPLGCGSTSSFGHLWARQFGLGSRHRGGPFLRRCSSLFSTISPLPLPNNSQKHTAPNHTFLWKPLMKLTGLKDSSTPTVFFWSAEIW